MVFIIALDASLSMSLSLTGKVPKEMSKTRYRAAAELIKTLLSRALRLRPMPEVALYRMAKTSEQLMTHVDDANAAYKKLITKAESDEELKMIHLIGNADLGELFRLVSRDLRPAANDILFVFTDCGTYYGETRIAAPCETRFVVINTAPLSMSSKQRDEIEEVSADSCGHMADIYGEEYYGPFELSQYSKHNDMVEDILRECFDFPVYTLCFGNITCKIVVSPGFDDDGKRCDTPTIEILGFTKIVNMVNIPTLTNHMIALKKEHDEVENEAIISGEEYIKKKEESDDEAAEWFIDENDEDEDFEDRLKIVVFAAQEEQHSKEKKENPCPRKGSTPIPLPDFVTRASVDYFDAAINLIKRKMSSKSASPARSPARSLSSSVRVESEEREMDEEDPIPPISVEELEDLEKLTPHEETNETKKIVDIDEDEFVPSKKAKVERKKEKGGKSPKDTKNGYTAEGSVKMETDDGEKLFDETAADEDSKQSAEEEPEKMEDEETTNDSDEQFRASLNLGNIKEELSDENTNMSGSGGAITPSYFPAYLSTESAPGSGSSSPARTAPAIIFRPMNYRPAASTTPPVPLMSAEDESSDDEDENFDQEGQIDDFALQLDIAEEDSRSSDHNGLLESPTDEDVPPESEERTHDNFPIILAHALKIEESVAICRLANSRRYAVLTSHERDDNSIFLACSMLPSKHEMPSFVPRLDKLIASMTEGMDFNKKEKKKRTLSYVHQRPCWTGQETLDMDINRIKKVLRKLPDRIHTFYKEINAFRNHAYDLNMQSILPTFYDLFLSDAETVGNVAKKHIEYIANYYKIVVPVEQRRDIPVMPNPPLK